MIPVNGISKLIGLLKIKSGKYKTSTGAGLNKQTNSLVSFIDDAHFIAEDVKLKLKNEIDETGGISNQSISIFVEAVLVRKIMKVDESLDLKKLTLQVSNAISADPNIKTQLQHLLKNL